jgi:putative FmdB family regulatory protein
MPLFDFLCLDCGRVSEMLLSGSSEEPGCPACGSQYLKRMLSAPSSLSGVAQHSLPGPKDTACCGSAPGQGAGCAGPGSCCGHGR